MIPPPVIEPLLSKLIVISLPNREELLFLSVFALPKASRIGFAARICCSRVPEAVADGPPPAVEREDTSARNCRMSLVASDLPAPEVYK